MRHAGGEQALRFGAPADLPPEALTQHVLSALKVLFPSAPLDPVPVTQQSACVPAFMPTLECSCLRALERGGGEGSLGGTGRVTLVSTLEACMSLFCTSRQGGRLGGGGAVVPMRRGSMRRPDVRRCSNESTKVSPLPCTHPVMVTWHTYPEESEEPLWPEKTRRKKGKEEGEKMETAYTCGARTHVRCSVTRHRLKGRGNIPVTGALRAARGSVRSAGGPAAAGPGRRGRRE